MAIPIYRHLNELHEATGSSLRTENDVFHCFRMSDLKMDVSSLPAFRSDFFTLALSYGSKNFTVTINGIEHTNLKYFLICIPPGQISSFRKEGNWEGFCTFFKAEFVQFQSEVNFLESYPFFDIKQINIFPVTEEQYKNFSLNYLQILEEQQYSPAYHVEIIRSLFLAVLWQVRRIFETTAAKNTAESAGFIIASKFQYLVNENFVHKVLVEQYAELLNISANHLTQTIKKTTGKTAKSIISQRRAEEAKYLLRYANEDIASISHYLGFSEPAHFNNFFKRETGFTPLSFRKFSKQ